MNKLAIIGFYLFICFSLSGNSIFTEIASEKLRNENYKEQQELSVSDKIVNADEDNDVLGSITLEVNGGTPPYSFLWFPDNEMPTLDVFKDSLVKITNLYSLNLKNIDKLYENFTSQFKTNTLNNLEPGIYKCRITDSKGEIFNYEGFVSTDLVFSNNDGFYYKEGSLVKTDPTREISALIGGIFSVEENSDNKISFVMSQDGISGAFGLKINTGKIGSYKDFDYGFYFDKGEINVIIEGDIKSTGIKSVKGDKLEIIPDKNNIIYYYNDKIIYEQVFKEPTKYAPAFLVSDYALMDEMFHEIVVILGPNAYGLVVNSFCNIDNSRSISIRTRYLRNVNYEWSGPAGFNGDAYLGQSTATDLIPGWYTINVTGERSDFISASYQFRLTYFVGYYVDWITESLRIDPPNKLTAIETNPNNSATSNNKSTNQSNAERWINHKLVLRNLQGTQGLIMEFLGIGFKETNNPNNFQNGVAILNVTTGINTPNIIFLAKYENGDLDADNAIIGNFQMQISFNINYADRRILSYMLAGNSDQLLFTFNFTDQNSVFESEVAIDSEGTSINETLCDFCNRKLCYYNVLKKKIDGGYARTLNGKLRFKYDEEYYVQNNTNLNYRIYQYEGGQEYNLGNNIVKYGDNRYILNTSTLSAAPYYILEVTNAKNEKRYLKFKVDNQNILDCED